MIKMIVGVWGLIFVGLLKLASLALKQNKSHLASVVRGGLGGAGGESAADPDLLEEYTPGVASDSVLFINLTYI